MNRFFLLLLVASLLFSTANVAEAQSVLVEAESFSDHGGWKLDTQFITEMGSPYLLAHGLGRSVDDAVTEVSFPETGTYHVFVRTKDWVARWKAPGQPGKFQLIVDGQALDTTFGTEGEQWSWQDGGTIEIDSKTAKIALHDLTGFDGRCDAILFSKDATPPPNGSEILPAWRRKMLGLDEAPTEKDGYDLVVVGGGYSGMGAALSAARSGCKVALIQDRPVLGGNGSSEVRVWAMGHIRRGKYPRIGEMIEEFADKATKSPGTYEEFGDVKKEDIVRAESNIDLFLNHHAFKVETDENRIVAVHAFDTRTSEQKRFSGTQFVDCTGHGTIGFLAGADFEMTPEGRMGMSNMWAWGEGKEPVEFPETPWALELKMEDFPYPRDHHGQWFWESGFDKDALGDAEGIRDWNLRAVYGAFNAMKNEDGAEQHKTAFLTWIAYIGGPRESRRLMGDVVLTKEDIVGKREFKDGCVPSTWSIDLHYPKKQYAKKFPENPFISIAVHDRSVDRSFGYPVPYRSFYSRNIENLFMAGRCVSVTHEALGTTRVMKTCGMMGEVVGRAASVCKLHSCSPREVFEKYWSEMDALLKLPGKAHRASVDQEFTVPADAMELAPERGPEWIPRAGRSDKKLRGQVMDDQSATMTGKWTPGSGVKGYFGFGYAYAAADSNAKIVFETEVRKSGKHRIGILYGVHENRGTSVPVVVNANGESTRFVVDMTKSPGSDDQVYPLGNFELSKDQKVTVEISTENAGGMVHADAIQLLPVK
ncbi:FAD-dependent oxidoreductase [Mariniblastus fucicola]|uniref:Fumarate reductase flavoprotein subunit n=1 Tax=Mariniblastus fucicola TaxID=980251 RepID=A0A5B9PLA5_9BACT|nr:FAD-dependent oxidoreductase [Mariniblastus fucicola]QEG23461.1 fumarate reductase flavoprotein subunit [Mariniblastus fucicola]